MVSEYLFDFARLQLSSSYSTIVSTDSSDWTFLLIASIAQPHGFARASYIIINNKLYNINHN